MSPLARRYSTNERLVQSCANSSRAKAQTSMQSIRIQGRTSVEDVLSWRLSDCDKVRIGRRSGFEAGAQGLALSTLAALRPGNYSPVLECDFEEPQEPNDIESTLLGSTFGFALVRLASRVQFRTRPASLEFKQRLSALYRARQGILGLGTSRSMVCIDPVFSLPPAVAVGAATPSPDYFPPPSTFAGMLNRMVEQMGFRRLLASNEESSVVSFVYETLRNSWEHGLAVSATRRSRSTRALLAEKLVLASSDLSSRHLSPELRMYLERISETNQGDLGLGVICLTVADQGDGIQSTLPLKDGLLHETPAERLARAFLPGESRKPIGVVKRGLGLPSVISSAHHLQALVRITSGNLVVGQDFSMREDKYPRLNFDAIRELPLDFACGTCVSIFVPEFAFSLDQRSLFQR